MFMNRIWSIGLVAVVLFSGQTAEAACNLGSRQAMQDYIESFASSFGSFNQQAAMGRNYQTNQRLSEFRQVYSECELNIRLTGMEACFGPASRMAAMNQRRTTSGTPATMFMETSDTEYQNQLPEVLRTLPAPLRNGLPANWRQVAQQNGWQAVTYRSRTVGNPGPTRSYMRVLFKIPGNPYERWIQFTIGELDNPNQPEQLVDAIAVNTQTRQISFNQFWRNQNGQDPRPRIEGAHGSGGNLDSCISCHPNGMRELSPAPGSYPAQDQATIESFNRSMEGYGRLAWQGLDVDAYGPPLGQAEGCTRCHNGYTGDPAISRGALTVMTAGSQYTHKLRDDMSMSPTTLKSRDLALKFLRDIPKLLSEPERQRMMREVYGGSTPSGYNKTRETLEWLRSNNGPSGQPYLSQTDYDAYSRALREMNADNSEVAATMSTTASSEQMREWFLADCEETPVSAQPPASVIDSDGVEESGSGSQGSGGSSASRQ